MEFWSHDDNLINSKFQRIISTFHNSQNIYYHLFLPPPYSIENEDIVKLNPLKYLFFHKFDGDKNTLICFNDNSNTLLLSEDKIILNKGFPKEIQIRILSTTQCTSSNGFSYTVHELFNDIYKQVEPPHFCLRIMEVYRDPILSNNFLRNEILNYPKLSNTMKAIDNAVMNTVVNETNFRDFLERMEETIDQICELVFCIPHTKNLPSAVKNMLNYCIFNAVTSKCHFTLLDAYHKAFKNQNIAAQRNSRYYTCKTLSTDKNEVSIQSLKNVLHMSSPCEAIECVCKFFNSVVSKFDGDEIAADDILPAICNAIAHNDFFGTHCVSFLTYLNEIYPDSGINEKTKYILTTCEIAASHLAMFDPQKDNEKIKKNNIEQKTKETIELLEDLLDFCSK